MTELRDGDVLLRPLRAEDLDALWEARSVGGALFKPRPGARERMRARIERSPAFAEGRIDLAIDVHDALVGQIEARQPPQGLPPGVFEIGVSLFATHDRGRGVGTTAIRLFTDFLFVTHRAERVQGSTWIENTAMRRVFERLGYSFEGVLRSFMPGEEGRRDDYALYAVTRADWSQTSR